MQSDLNLPPMDSEIDRQQNQRGFRRLMLLAIPAGGFLSAGLAYIGYYKIAAIWPYILLPTSLFVFGLIFLEGLRETRRVPFISRIPLTRINQANRVVVFLFLASLAWWLYYLIQYIELHQ